MFRRTFIAALASLAFLSPLAVTAQAHEFHHEHHQAYRVYYRHNCDSPWHFMGSFSSHHEAERAVQHLRHRGMEAYFRG